MSGFYKISEVRINTIQFSQWLWRNFIHEANKSSKENMNLIWMRFANKRWDQNWSEETLNLKLFSHLDPAGSFQIFPRQLSIPSSVQCKFDSSMLPYGFCSLFFTCFTIFIPFFFDFLNFFLVASIFSKHIFCFPISLFFALLHFTTNCNHLRHFLSAFITHFSLRKLANSRFN